MCLLKPLTCCVGLNGVEPVMAFVPWKIPDEILPPGKGAHSQPLLRHHSKLTVVWNSFYFSPWLLAPTQTKWCTRNATDSDTRTAVCKGIVKTKAICMLPRENLISFFSFFILRQYWDSRVDWESIPSLLLVDSKSCYSPPFPHSFLSSPFFRPSLDEWLCQNMEKSHRAQTKVFKRGKVGDCEPCFWFSEMQGPLTYEDGLFISN